MHSYIPISTLNDYIFCPRSIYLHGLYGNFAQQMYHRKPQTVGKIKHENIDKSRYSSAKRYKQGMVVYSEKYQLAGKIDIYDSKEKTLIERKYKIKHIYDGYKYQLYAQYFCLTEMGRKVKKMYLHSLADNKRYPMPVPAGSEKKKFEQLVKNMQNARAEKLPVLKNKAKCEQCIYKPLCH